MNFLTILKKTIPLSLCLLLIGCGSGDNTPFQAINGSTIYDTETGVIYWNNKFHFPLYNADGTLKTIADSESAQEELILDNRYLQNINDSKDKEDKIISIESNNADVVSVPHNIGISISEDEINTEGFNYTDDISKYKDFNIVEDEFKYTINDEVYSDTISTNFEIYIKYIDKSNKSYFFIVDNEEGIEILNDKSKYQGECKEIRFCYNNEDNDIIDNENVEDPNGNYYYKNLSNVTLIYYIN